MSSKKNEFALTINNRDVWVFFNENKEISFESACLILVDILSITVKNTEATVTNTVTNQILTNLTEQMSRIKLMQNDLSSLKNMQNDLNSLKNDLSRFNTEMVNSITVKFLEIKREYTDEVKSIIASDYSLASDKLDSLIYRNNCSLFDKTQLLLSDIVPRTNEIYYKQIEQNLECFKHDITNQTNRLLESKNDNNDLAEFLKNFDLKTTNILQNIQQPFITYISASEERINTSLNQIREQETSKEIIQSKTYDVLNEFMKNYDLKTTNILQNIQQPILSYISASEDRLNNNLNQIREHEITKDANQSKTFDVLTEFLNKNKYSSSSKGAFSENQLGEILTNLYPSCYVKETKKIPESGDYILTNREGDKPEVLFENKDYTTNVNKDEVNKFLRDMTEQNCHGVLISQKTGIVGRKQYEIEIYNNKIAVYVLNCNYDNDKIKIAVDIIDALSNSLLMFNDDNVENNISNELLEEINIEYAKFSQHKVELIDSIKDITKDMTKKLTTKVEDIKFPSLAGFLSVKFGNYSKIEPILENKILCTLCNTFYAKNATALASHKNGCLRKQKKNNVSETAVVSHHL